MRFFHGACGSNSLPGQWVLCRNLAQEGLTLTRHTVSLCISASHSLAALSNTFPTRSCDLGPPASAMSLSPDSTQRARLPPWEVAKAAAYNEVISDLEKHLGKSCWELLGRGKVPYVRSKLTLVGGGSPSPRSVRALFERCKDKTWYPGRAPEDTGGRPSIFSEHVKDEVARVAMESKAKLLKPTPARCRALLPKKTINKKTGQTMSDRTFQRIFTSRCYDERKDDPWCYLPGVQQDYLPDTMKPQRVTCCSRTIDEFMLPGLGA